jgi:serine/threonine protein kinase
MTDATDETGAHHEAPPTTDVALYVGPAESPDRYELLAERSGGTEGFLYQARFREPDAGMLVVAVKAMRVSDERPDLDRWIANRAVLRTLHHPNVVRYLDHFVGAAPHRFATAADTADAADLTTGAEAAVYYEVMEWIDGPTLDQLVRDGRTPLTERWPLVEQLAAAVDYLHEGSSGGTNAVLHRDIKPANVIVHTGRGAVLVDFGLARVEMAHTMRQAAGTEGYRAPELLHEGTPPSRESDRWSAAATAHFVLTTQPPSVASPRLVAEAAQAAGAAPEPVVEAFARALDPDPAQRPARLVDWAGDVGQALAPAPAPVRAVWRHPAFLVAAGAAVAAATFGVVKLTSGGDGRAATTTTTRPAKRPATTTSITSAPAPGDCITDPANDKARNSDGQTHSQQRCDLLVNDAEVHAGASAATPVIGRMPGATGVYFFCKTTGAKVQATVPSGAKVQSPLWARTQLSAQQARAPVRVDGWVSATVFRSPIDSLRWCGSTEKPTS